MLPRQLGVPQDVHQVRVDIMFQAVTPIRQENSEFRHAFIKVAAILVISHDEVFTRVGVIQAERPRIADGAQDGRGEQQNQEAMDSARLYFHWRIIIGPDALN